MSPPDRDRSAPPNMSPYTNDTVSKDDTHPLLSSFNQPSLPRNMLNTEEDSSTEPATPRKSITRASERGQQHTKPSSLPTSPAHQNLNNVRKSTDRSVSVSSPGFDTALQTPRTALKNSSPAQSLSPMVTPKHANWVQSLAHTTKCDSCDTRNTSCFQRCKLCNLQMCLPCMVYMHENHPDDKHATNPNELDWSPLPKRNLRPRQMTQTREVSSSPTTTPKRITRSAKRAPARAKKEETDSSESPGTPLVVDERNKQWTALFGKKSNERNTNTNANGGVAKNGFRKGNMSFWNAEARTGKGTAFFGDKSNEHESDEHSSDSNVPRGRKRQYSSSIDEANTPSVASGSFNRPLTGGSDVFNTVDRVLAAKKLDTERETAWNTHPGILALREEGKVDEAEEVLDAAYTLMAMQKGLRE